MYKNLIQPQRIWTAQFFSFAPSWPLVRCGPGQWYSRRPSVNAVNSRKLHYCSPSLHYHDSTAATLHTPLQHASSLSAHKQHLCFSYPTKAFPTCNVLHGSLIITTPKPRSQSCPKLLVEEHFLCAILRRGDSGGDKEDFTRFEGYGICWGVFKLCQGGGIWVG